MRSTCEEAVDLVTLFLSGCRNEEQQIEMMNDLLATEEVVRNLEWGIEVINWFPNDFQRLYQETIQEDMEVICKDLISQIKGLAALGSNDGYLSDWLELESALDDILSNKRFTPSYREDLEAILSNVKQDYRLEDF